MRALALALVLLLAFACEAERPSAQSAAPRARVRIGMHVVDAEVADTPARKQRGLSGRAGLAQDEGMLFPYAVADRYAFWMPDMQFDIDILWIRAGRIVHVEPDVSRLDPTRIYRPPTPADAVLELPAGTARRRGFSVGDRVEVEGAG